MEVYVRQLLVVDDVVGISDGTQFLGYCLLGVGVVGCVQVHYVIWSFVFFVLSLNYWLVTIWFIRDLALDSSSLSTLYDSCWV